MGRFEFNQVFSEVDPKLETRIFFETFSLKHGARAGGQHPRLEPAKKNIISLTALPSDLTSLDPFITRYSI
jgi:hypothetical protein